MLMQGPLAVLNYAYEKVLGRLNDYFPVPDCLNKVILSHRKGFSGAGPDNN